MVSGALGCEKKLHTGRIMIRDTWFAASMGSAKGGLGIAESEEAVTLITLFISRSASQMNRVLQGTDFALSALIMLHMLHWFEARPRWTSFRNIRVKAPETIGTSS
uniref:Uncharacterized protein n=1 Tax=Candidatus Kentrum sp. LFY TaxID=2126342 RepID=A0A450X6L5_9GAMM|nr:MAG: hypothetical protein BECKLFY1418C_GA0070996_12012 [Candidatus Kentron sp. LFY]